VSTVQKLPSLQSASEVQQPGIGTWLQVALVQVSVGARVPFIAARARCSEALAQLLRDEASRLFASPRDQTLLRVLERAYFNPAAKQEAAAEELQLSVRTYRRYLKLAVDRLADSFWRDASV
jgi:hypothetical protein